MSLAYDKILLILLGIITLVVAIYLYTTYISSKSISCEACRNLLSGWCSKCKDERIPQYICECSVKCNFFSSDCNPNSLPTCASLSSVCEKFNVSLNFGKYE